MGGEFVLGSKKSVLLLNTVPRLLLWSCIKDLIGVVAEVGVGRNKGGVCCIAPDPSLADHHDVVASSEGIAEVSSRLQDHLRSLSVGLPSGRTIIIPIG